MGSKKKTPAIDEYLKARSALKITPHARNVHVTHSQLAYNSYSSGNTYVWHSQDPAFSRVVADFYEFLAREGMTGRAKHIEITDGGGMGPWGTLLVRTERLPHPTEDHRYGYVNEQKMWPIASAHRVEASQCWQVKFLHHPYDLLIPDELRPFVVEPIKTRSTKRVEEVPVAQRRNFLFPYTGQEIADSIDKQIDTAQVAIDNLKRIDLSALDGVYHPEGSGQVKDDVARKIEEAEGKIARLKKEAAPYRKAAEQSFDLDIEDVEHFGLADVDAEPVAAA